MYKKTSRLRKISRNKSENYLVDLNSNQSVEVKRIQKKQKKFIEEEDEIAKLLQKQPLSQLNQYELKFNKREFDRLFLPMKASLFDHCK